MATSTNQFFGRALTYSHLAVVLASVAVLALPDSFGRWAFAIVYSISMLSLPVFGMFSLWLFVQAFEQGDAKKLAIAIVEIALSLVQAGFIIPQLQ